MTWKTLPPLPDPVGFAGPFAGTAGNALVVAGGSNFPKGRPWMGDPKMWYASIYVLESPEGDWKLADVKLPCPMGYGVSVSYGNQLICVGGDDGVQHHAETFAIDYAGGSVRIIDFPPLPKPLAYGCGTVVRDVLYVAAGTNKTGATEATRSFYSMDLSAPLAERTWKILPAWDGPARILPVAGSDGEKFYLFSGAELFANGTPTPGRHFLSDAYSYAPAEGWRKLADLPHAVVAAPSPAADVNGRLLIVGGDTGKLFTRNAELRDAHPGFSDDIIAYDPAAKRWTDVGLFPKDPGPDPQHNPNAGLWPAVTAPAVLWRGCLVIPAGEARPGVRTPRVPAMKLPVASPATGVH